MLNMLHAADRLSPSPISQYVLVIQLRLLLFHPALNGMMNIHVVDLTGCLGPEDSWTISPVSTYLVSLPESGL